MIGNIQPADQHMFPQLANAFKTRCTYPISITFSEDWKSYSIAFEDTRRELRWDHITFINAFIAGWRAAREIS